MDNEKIYRKALALEPLTADEAMRLYDTAPTGELTLLAWELRQKQVPGDVVTWQIDRNVNITNVCISGCKFCNFHCKPHQTERAYVTTIEQYAQKIEETLALGGDQLLLQGGLHPKLGIDFYENLFRELKTRYPQIRLHALGAPEVFHIARISGLDTETTLRRLVDAGLNSLPGAGAEILDNGVRRTISPGKPNADQWLDVMRTAAPPRPGDLGNDDVRARRNAAATHRTPDPNPRPAGRMSGRKLRIHRLHPVDLPRERNAARTRGRKRRFVPLEYLRIIAISRIVLHNIRNIQASWLTVGKATAQMALHGGANDMGSIMIEENVVSSAGAHNRFDAQGIRQAIREAGFVPRLRNQLYEFRTNRPHRNTRNGPSYSVHGTFPKHSDNPAAI